MSVRPPSKADFHTIAQVVICLAAASISTPYTVARDAHYRRPVLMQSWA